MRILLTGSQGYLGSALLLTLQERGHTIFTPSGDVADEDYWLDAIHDHPEVILHLAAETDLYEAERNPVKNWHTNFLPIVHAARACHLFSHIRLVLASTVTVQGMTDTTIPQTEAEPCYPCSVYDMIKYTAELYLMSIASPESVVLRLSNVYGPSPSTSGPNRGIVNKWINTALSGDTPQLYKGATFLYRDYLQIEDAVNAFVTVAEYPKPLWATFNVCSGEGTMIKDTFDMISKATNVQGIFADDPTDLHMIEYRSWVGSHQKLTQATGWRPEVSLVDGIGRTIEAFRRTQQGQAENVPVVGHV